MLTAEEADQQIDELHNKSWRNDAVARAEKLRGKKRTTALEVLGGKLSIQQVSAAAMAERQDRQREAATFLDEASATALRALFETCHPTLGGDLAVWWEWARSNHRRHNGQLAPNRPELSRLERFSVLQRLLDSYGGYPVDGRWIAQWAGHRSNFRSAETADLLLASLDDEGHGAEIYNTLLDTIRGQHPTAVMGDHVLSILTRGPRLEGWKLVEGMLIGAQRQEGLRASILGCIPNAHPECLRRLLRLLIDQDMLRFGSVLRAVGQWVGVAADAGDKEAANRWLATLIEVSAYTPEQVRQATAPIELELSLAWLARRDAPAALKVAREVIRNPSGDRDLRLTVVQWLSRSGDPRHRELVEYVVADPDPGVSAVAIAALRFNKKPKTEVFEAVEDLLGRWPDEPINCRYSAISSTVITVDRSQVFGALLAHRGELPFARIEPCFDKTSENEKHLLVNHFHFRTRMEPEERTVLVELIGKGRKHLRLSALRALGKTPLAAGEATQVEQLVGTKTEDIRRAAIEVLAEQQPGDIAASARRLWNGSEELRPNQQTRDAAAELLSLSADDDATAAAANELLADSPSEDQRGFLVAAAGAPDDDAVVVPFGLFTEEERTPAVQPSQPSGIIEMASPKAGELLLSLDSLVEEHRDVELSIPDRTGSTRQVLLADYTLYPSPFTSGRNGRPIKAPEQPLAELFTDWWQRNRSRFEDPDGFGLFRAAVLHHRSLYGRHEKRFFSPLPHTTAVIGILEPVRLQHYDIVGAVLGWLLVSELTEAEPEQCGKLMLAECSRITENELLTTVPPADADENPLWRSYDVRRHVPSRWWIRNFYNFRLYLDSESADDQLDQLFRMQRWQQQPLPHSSPIPIETDVLLQAHSRGLATDADLLDLLLGLSSQPGYDGRPQPHELLGRFTARDRSRTIERLPGAVEVADRVRDRVLAIELQRGELPTDASRYVQALGCVEGAELVTDFLSALGSQSLVRGWNSHESKTGQISRVLRKSFPLPDNTGAELRRLATGKQIGTERLVELAIYAPQWAALVEEAIGWAGLADGVWWLHAHTKDRHWSVDPRVSETWASTVAEYTALTPEDLVDGATDVEWFHRFHPVLGKLRWSVVYNAANLSSSGVGHNRAKLFADAMLGQVDPIKLVMRIEQKRHQDSVRALGLLPLPRAKKRRSEELLRRYLVIKGFEKGASNFGVQRKTNERLAARIAVDNLARTAGYADSQRFSWAMEEADIADLKGGPVEVSIDDVTVALTIDGEGMATTSVDRAGKTLKNVPIKLRKVPDIVLLKERQKELASQVSRIRQSLEAAMVNANEFAAVELQDLGDHPIVGPLLRSLVICDRRRSTGLMIETGFVGPSGRARKLQEPLRLAHPADLISSGDWSKWRTLFFDREIRQPFKQVFRELYLSTESERGRYLTNRYDGHQVQPSQARALLGQRGWYHRPDDYTFSSTNHTADVVSHLQLGIEPFGWGGGDLPVVGNVTFRRRRGGVQLSIDEVPAPVFSETMRDVDLVVSVAHAGGVDPETSQSTVEMRIALARETARVLRLTNVEFTDTHAIIAGAIAEYSVHLGSGVAHRRTGAALTIQAAPSQRRGRLFLPFVDDDPKTAEILSILLLLARDDEIQDPTILRQIR